ncbi:MAG TPA: hypothetical protein VNO54_01470 [Streptosporangiaceae bacterium]|nr:hypothetical protein [Streptosporangiaceae bacterium]
MPDEPAGDPAGVARSGGAPVDVRSKAGCGDAPVAAGQAADGGRVQGLSPLGAGGVAGFGEEAGHLLRPVLLPGLELVKVPQVAQEMGLMKNSS